MSSLIQEICRGGFRKFERVWFWGFLVSISCSQFGAAAEKKIQLNFSSLRNWVTGYENGYVQYGVDQKNRVVYVVVSSGMNESALEVVHHCGGKDDGKVSAYLVHSGKVLPPPDQSDNFIVVSKDEVVRFHMKPIGKKEFLNFVVQAPEISLDALNRYLEARGKRIVPQVPPKSTPNVSAPNRRPKL